MTTGVNTKLIEVLQDFTNALAKLAAIDTDINLIRGPELLDLGDLNANLAAIRAEQSQFIGDATQLLQAITGAVGLLDPLSSDTVLKLLTDLRDHLGLPTGDATTTVLGRLAAIERLSRCGCPPEPPDLTDPQAPCSNPYTSISEATRTSPEWPSRVFAGFAAPAPDGLSFAQFLPDPIESCELEREENLIGFYIYIQSSAPLASLNPTSPLQVKTNVWFNADGYIPQMAISVPVGNDLTVYICVPEGEVWTDCVEVSSVPGTYSTLQPFSMDLQVAPLSTIPAQSLTNTWQTSDTTHSFNVANTVTTNDWLGVTITLISGGPTRITWLDANGQMDGTNLDVVTAAYTIVIHTTMVTIASFNASNPAAAAFTVEICPPA